jgi:RecA-family ATPase
LGLKVLSLKQIAIALNGEIRGDEVFAPGPGHSAKDRTLSVKIKAGGEDIVVHSFSPADNDLDCLKYAREKIGIEFKTNGRKPEIDLAKVISDAVASQKKRKPTYSFSYKDRDGTVLYQVRKYKSGGCSAHQPDGKGGWIDDLKGFSRRVLYRWPELIQFPDATVFFTEGEKDTDRVASLGLCATTIAFGNWTDECVNALAGRNVWILEDNDEAGRKRALEAAHKLHPVATSIKIIRLPGLEPKGDVSDWLDAGHTQTELEDFCCAAPGWKPTDEPPPKPEPKAKEPPSLPFINIAAWDDEPMPEQDWSVQDRFPLRQSVLFSGEGSTGKSTIYLHLSGAHTLGKDWLGALPEPGPALFIEAEDDERVMQRRMWSVANHFNTTFAALANSGLHLLSLAGQDAVIATATRSGKIEPTKLYNRILQAVGDIKPKMIGIASSANVYAGSEVDRSQVQQFASLLTRLAILANGTCHLISHPSLTGINSDTGISGNTQWHNAFRARCYLKGSKPEAGEQPDNDLRELVFKKNNYGPVSETIVLRYQNGLFLPVPGVSSLNKAAQDETAETLFLDLLKRFTAANRNVSDKTGPGYAPTQFAKEDEAKRAMLNSKAFEAAMRRLFKANKIWNEPYGKPSRQHFRIAVKA